MVGCAAGEGHLDGDEISRPYLADVLARLWHEPGLLAELRARIPSSDTLPRIDDHVRRILAIYEEVLRVGAPALGPEDAAQRAADESFLETWDRECARPR